MNSHSSRVGVPAERHEQIATGSQALIEIESGNGAGGSLADSLFIYGNDDGRPMKALDQTRSYNPHHSEMPLARSQNNGTRWFPPIDQIERFTHDGSLERLPSSIQRFKMLSQPLGLRVRLSREQLDTLDRIVQTARRIQPWGKLKSDGVHSAGSRYAGHLAQSSDTATSPT